MLSFAKEPNKQDLINLFWQENPVFHEILIKSKTLDETRERVFHYIYEYERKYLQGKHFNNAFERKLAKGSLQALKNIFSSRSERLTNFSALRKLYNLAHLKESEVTEGFLEEFRNLFFAMKGNTGVTEAQGINLGNNFREAHLYKISRNAHKLIQTYANGLDEAIVRKRAENKERILKCFNANQTDWDDFKWQLTHVIRDEHTLSKLIELTDEEKGAIKKARENKIPFGITPYYVSLMDQEPHRKDDHAIRAQVIPTLKYVEGVLEARVDPTKVFDYMGEKDTSPEDLITRRYPMIAIMKPFNTCAQICVYCQRNWEIEDVLSQNAQHSFGKIRKALEWFYEHKEVSEILITGGDPGIMSTAVLEKILDLISTINHIKRVRIGTRTPVVLPMRLNEDFGNILAKHHVPGRREIVLMTHFEHAYEITPDAMEAIRSLKTKGIAVYNQGVFTYENARRFEMVALRRSLRMIGVDPYYTFNAKGKEETQEYRVPISRLLQEQAEEARLTPGVERTDEAVFNIPRLGKNYLKAGQDHELLMIKEKGQRVYEFFSWDISDNENVYLFEDVPIMDFLQEMHKRGEDIENYKTIWYYY